MSGVQFPASHEAADRLRNRPDLRAKDPVPALPGTGQGETGPADKRILVSYGFWIYLLSDIVLFSAFFAAFAVQHGASAGGPRMPQIVDVGRAALETGLLLASSYTCMLSFAATHRKNLLWTQIFLAVTGLLGLAFVLLEAQEFFDLAARGITPQRSGMLTAFFGLVGLHGLHVSLGGLWLGTMMAQVQVKGFTTQIVHRLTCFNLFWHTLDIVWIGIFTIVYLMGGAS
ncbi:cytochrome c oxidase subunit 3 [Novosphingobium terrae]|uniref:cytochrome c oxidase subunit 3 n=1 Tax=Novosphingobium terrae TaxID=2726189 RepID=UPI0019811CBF|nr:cytochrome c oxidase subunit 3 [Novosphingobium terrae]